MNNAHLHYQNLCNMLVHLTDFFFEPQKGGYVSGQLPTRTIPHHVDIGPDEWFYWLEVVLVGSCPRDHDPGGQ